MGHLSSVTLDKGKDKGTHFTPRPKRAPTSSIVAKVEDALQWCKALEELVVKTRIKVIGVLSKHSHLSMNLSHLERKALCYLAS